MSRHVMLDLETLGSCQGGLILSIGAVAFNNEGVTETFYRRIDIGSSLLAGFIVEEGNLKFWREQNEIAIARAFYCDGAVSVQTALADFAQFVSKQCLVWAKGPDYDCVLLSSAYKKLNIPLPWSFRNTRDVRTILALSGVKQKQSIDAHDALVDARLQAEAAGV